MTLPDLRNHALPALVLTMFTAAVVHLGLVTWAAIDRGAAGFVNPLNFLGITIVAPGLARSDTWFVLGWAGLVGLFFIYLYLVRRHVAAPQSTADTGASPASDEYNQ